MQPFDVFSGDWISQENARVYLSDEEYARFQSISEGERSSILQSLLDKPMSDFTVVHDLYFRSKIASLLQKLYNRDKVTVLEAASGDADMVPQALARSNPGSLYITANMNHLLNESLLKKMEGLPLEYRLVDDDAAQILRYVEAESVDCLVFQHGVNDILQGILCGKNGIDTVYADWMAILPQMIRLLQEECAAGTFQQSVRGPFLALMRALMRTLKPGGVAAICHYQFQLDLDWGYPPDLFENLVPMLRGWFSEDAPGEEFQIEGFPSQWWLFLRKHG